MRRYLIKAIFVGSQAGNFTIVDSLGNVLDTGVTKEDLLSGIYYDIDSQATSVNITSDDPCSNTTNITLSNVAIDCSLEGFAVNSISNFDIDNPV